MEEPEVKLEDEKIVELASMQDVNEKHKRVAWLLARGTTMKQTAKLTGYSEANIIRLKYNDSRIKALIKIYEKEQSSSLDKEWAIKEALHKYKTCENEAASHKFFVTFCQLQGWLVDKQEVTTVSKAAQEVQGKSKEELVKMLEEKAKGLGINLAAVTTG